MRDTIVQQAKTGAECCFELLNACELAGERFGTSPLSPQNQNRSLKLNCTGQQTDRLGTEFLQKGATNMIQILILAKRLMLSEWG